MVALVTCQSFYPRHYQVSDMAGQLLDQTGGMQPYGLEALCIAWV